jgi:hypothetical protein
MLREKSIYPEVTMNRYFDPDEVRRQGRKLLPGDFASLKRQINEDEEALIGLYWNQVLADVATELDSQQRMDKMEGLYKPAPGYYAISKMWQNQ